MVGWEQALVTESKILGYLLAHDHPNGVLHTPSERVVALRRELPEHGLLRGDVGAIVGVYEAGGYEVEFAAAVALRKKRDFRQEIEVVQRFLSRPYGGKTTKIERLIARAERPRDLLEQLRSR